MKVTLLTVTPRAEETIVYIARVSNPSNQAAPAAPPASRLLNYLIKHAHWSPFEHAYMTLEMETSRAIAAQLLRHRSFVFQEFSQRYQVATDFCTVEARLQDSKNRQNSLQTDDEELAAWFMDAQDNVQTVGRMLYEEALAKGIAKEQARFLLPLSTKTRLYMTGNIRSWIHYIQLRSGIETQKEHRELALEAKRLFCEQFPLIASALEWTAVDLINK